MDTQNVNTRNVKESTLSIVDLTKKGVIARQTHYRDGYLYYNIELLGIDGKEGDKYRLILDVTEFSGCDVQPVCNASLFRRWIRKALTNGELNKV
jgi:hypothetical protein